MIKACCDSGVGKLFFRGLSVTFQGYRPAWVNENSHVNSPTADRIDTETTEQESFAAKEQQVAELMLTDPGEYERLIEAGELEDGGRNSGDGLE